MPATKAVDPITQRDTPIIVGGNNKAAAAIAAQAIFDSPLQPPTSDAPLVDSNMTMKREGSIDSSLMAKVRILGKDEIEK